MIHDKKILAVTLARGGSKSVPMKNIRDLAGEPLIAYTINAVKASKFIDEYIISTDDEAIKSVSEKYGVSVPFIRPEELSSDTATSGDALCHAVEFMEAKNGFKYDFIVELMATNPLKKTQHIDDAIIMLDDTNADSVVAVTRVYDQHPARIKRLDEKGRMHDFCVVEPLEARRQDLSPPAYIRCGSIYAIRRDYLIETRARYGSEESYALVIPHDCSVNVDNELDFILVEAMIKKLLINKDA